MASVFAKFELKDLRTDPVVETGIPINEESAKLVDKIHESTEMADVEVEEKKD